MAGVLPASQGRQAGRFFLVGTQWRDSSGVFVGAVNMRFFRVLLLSTGLALACEPLLAWTPPVGLSPFGPESTRPRITRGSAGAMHIVWVDKTNWDIYYRFRAGNGAWGPVEPIAVSSQWTGSCNVFEDGQGRANIVYTGTATGGTSDLHHAIKTGGTWSTSLLFPSAGNNEDYPTARADSSGNIHLVYFRSNHAGTSDQGVVVYRQWNGSAWSGETILGNINEKAVYHRPDMFLDAQENVHVAWAQDAKTFVYRKRSGANWQAIRTIGTTSEYFGHPVVTAASATSIVASISDWHNNQSVIKWTASNDGGNTWTPLQILDYGQNSKLDSNHTGVAHIVYMANPPTTTSYRKWTGSAWTVAETITPPTRWQGWPAVAVDNNGVAYCVYDDGDIWSQSVVRFVASVDTDITPPGQVTSPTISASDGSIYLNWANPADPDFKGTLIRYKTTGFPTGPSDGIPVYNGTGTSFTHTGLVIGTTYYYSIFTYDNRPNYSAAVHLQATPLAMTCGLVRSMPDGSVVDLKNVVVSGVFSTEGYFYVQQPDRSSGIRVASAGTGLAAGDRVNVSGIVATRVLSGQPSEREIRNASFTKTASGAPPAPLSMSNRALGGEPAGPMVPGVINGMGLNNIGLLVRLTGRITFRLSNIIHIEDGSGILDPTGRLGVMVRCPSTSIPYNVGDVVQVTGISAGSIAIGSPTNRRYLLTRDWSDLQKLN